MDLLPLSLSCTEQLGKLLTNIGNLPENNSSPKRIEIMCQVQINATFPTNMSRNAKLLKIGLKHFNLSHLLEKGTKKKK